MEWECLWQLEFHDPLAPLLILRDWRAYQTPDVTLEDVLRKVEQVKREFPLFKWRVHHLRTGQIVML